MGEQPPTVALALGSAALALGSVAEAAHRVGWQQEQVGTALQAMGYAPDQLDRLTSSTVIPEGAREADAAIAAAVTRIAAEHVLRLNRQLVDLLAAGEKPGDLVVVTSPTYPHGVVMTAAQCSVHQRILAASVSRVAEIMSQAARRW